VQSVPITTKIVSQFHRDEEMAEQRNESVIFKSWFADCYIEMTFANRYMYMQDNVVNTFRHK
jgi:hypothetical protein